MAGDGLGDAIRQRRGRAGAPLSGAVRAEAESVFGVDLGHVRVHRDEQAHDLTHRAEASAFAVDGHVFFRDGAYEPAARRGRELLGHELAHTVQQAPGIAAGDRGVGTRTDTEREADEAGRSFATGSPVGSSAADGPRPLVTPASASRHRIARRPLSISDTAEERRASRPLARRGMRGDHVVDVQRKLNARGVPAGALAVDGIFGPRTDRAVRSFQALHDLQADGVVGPRTWARLLGPHGGADARDGREPASGLVSEPPLEEATDRGSGTSPGGEARAGVEDTAASPMRSVAAAAGAAVGDWSSEVATRVRAIVGAAASRSEEEPEAGAQLLSRELEVIFERFSEVPVVIRPPEGDERTVRVHTPYFINSRATERSRRKHEAAMAARAREEAFFRHMVREHSWHARHGKATPNEIGAILQAALDEPVIEPQTRSEPTADDLRSWLREHGIGVDCSGFVSLALTHLVERQRHAEGLEGPVEHTWRHSTALRPSNEDFDAVGRPDELAPGDTMYVPGHVRVVATVDVRGDAVEFSTFESKPGGRERVGMAEQRWRYPDGSSFTDLQREVAGEWENAGNPLYGRYRGLSE